MNIYKDNNHVVIENIYYDGRNDVSLLAPMNTLALDSLNETILIKSSKNGDVLCAVDEENLYLDGTLVDPETLSVDFDAIAYSEGSGPGPGPTPTNDYFTITNLTNNQMTVRLKNSAVFKRFDTNSWTAYGPNSFTGDFSLDDGETWSTVTITNSSSFTVPANGKLLIKNGDYNNTRASWNEGWCYAGCGFNIDQDYAVSGKVSYLFEQNMIMGGSSNAVISGLFASEDHLIDASTFRLDIIPVNNNTGTTSGLFNNCTNLLFAPKKLEAKKLMQACYASMFAYCYSITQPPIIEATEVDSAYPKGCLTAMFADCTSLTTTPDLTYSNTGSSFYDRMFYNCTALKTLPTIIVPSVTGSYFFSNTFYNCGFETLELNDLLNRYVNVWDWERMFGACASLKTIKMNLSNCSAEWFSNNSTSLFYRCSAVENIEIGDAINSSKNISGFTNLTYASVMNILTAAASTTNSNSKTLTFNCSVTDQSSEIANLVAECVTKGWTISGLTIL